MSTVSVDFGSTLSTSPGYFIANSTGAIASASTRVTAGIVTIVAGKVYQADIALASSFHTIVWDSTGSGSRVEATEDLTAYRVQALMANRIETNSSSGACVIYREGSTTIFMQSTAYEDYLGTTPYAGNGIERRNELA